VHPQFWPEDLEYSGKKVVVIGSGATAMTLVPAMAKKGAQVTMLQRSPTYVVSAPAVDKIANALRKFLPENWAYAITRFKNIKLGNFFYNRTRTQPEKVKTKILDMVRKALPDYDVDTHFTPSYNPWDQRLCLIPDDDLYDVIKDGTATVVTDTIDTFTESGIKLVSGEELEADIIVTATGLKLSVANGLSITVDGKAIKIPDTVSYKGMMYSDIPNMIQTFGYINASWTLRADIIAEYACRLLNRMDELGMRQCTPRLREEDKNMERLPWIQDFSAGYMQRSMHLLPRQGDNGPWKNTQNYALDKKLIRSGPLEDGAMQFSNPPGSVAALPRSQEAEEETANAA
jgi:cation diffusion facilitator CzcD-associated flavoprotein CzcO